MFTGNSVMFEIIDIIRLNRNNFEMKTVNKWCYCLSCRLCGESKFFYEDKEFHVTEGNLLYIPKNCTYSQKTKGEEIVCFHLKAYGTPLDALKIFKNDFTDEVCVLFDEVEKIWRQKKDNYYYNCLSILYKILSLCNADFNDSTMSENVQIKKSLELLNKNIFNPELSVDEIYKKSNSGRTRFNEIFKKIYGTTPRKYIYTERIKKAQMLLKSGNYTNEEISYLCGFSDVKYFYVVFKKMTGMTTKEYKNISE